MMKKILFLLSILIVIVGIGMINKDEQSTALAQMNTGGFSNVSPFIRDGDAIRLRSTIDYIGTYADPIPNIIVDYITASSTFITDAEFDYILVNEVATSTILRVGDGTAAIPSYSFASDTDTGLYRVGANVMGVSLNGTRTFSYSTGGIFSYTSGSNQSGLLAEVPSATNPNIVPLESDIDTGIGYDPTGAISLVDDGTQAMKVASTSVQVVDGTAAIPAYSFLSDPDMGLYYSSASTMKFSSAGSEVLTMDTGGLSGHNAHAFGVLNEIASSINPTLVPDRSDLNTGIGWNSADELSLIAGGTEGLRIDFNELEVQPLMTLATGPIELEEDAGAVTAINLPVSSTPDDGDEESMSFAIDSNAVLKVKGSADGTGGANDFQVVIDPQGTFGSASLPSLAFGDGDTGLYESGDDTLVITLGGSANWDITSTVFGSSSGSQCALLRETASDTNPNLVPDENDKDTGIGHAGADQLSLIAGATGFLTGSTTLITLTVTTTVATGDFYVDTNLLYVDSSADRIGIATTTPATLLDVFSTGTSTITIDSNSATQGACLKFKDFDGDAYTYCTTDGGTLTCGTDSCE